MQRLNPVLATLKGAFYGVWALIGIIVLAAFLMAVIGDSTTSDNLKLASATDVQEESAESQQTQPQQQPQQPAQPTQEQLDCVADEVGAERFTELQQGEQPTQEESQVLQTCLQPQ